MLHASTPALAQSDSQPPVPSDPCKAEPRNNQKPQPETKDQLTEKLDRCNDVLKPPPNGDKEIEMPPPDTGNTPVIPPGQLPDQQPEKPDDQN
jgi:hypothetical protein